MTFDLEKARAETEHLRENIKEEFSCMCGVCHACGFNPEEMKEALDEIERLRGEMENYGDDYVCQMKSKDARIKELEDALAEYQRLGKTISEVVVPCLTAHGNCDQCRPKAKAACDAIETIRKGKIGPDASKKISHLRPYEVVAADLAGMLAKSWQITDDRKAAIGRACDALLWIDRIDSDNQTHINVLRAMLEAGQ